MSQPSTFHTLAAVAPCQAVFAGEFHSLWLVCQNGEATVRVRDARTEAVQPLADAPVAALHAALDAALAGSAQINLSGPDGVFSLTRAALLNGYEYCLTHAVRNRGTPAAPGPSADASAGARDREAVAQFAAEIAKVVLARGLAIADAVTAMGAAAKALAVHADFREPQGAMVAAAPTLLAEGFGAHVVMAGADPTRLAELYAADDAPALLANAQLRVVSASVH